VPERRPHMKPNFVKAGLCAVVSTALALTPSAVTATAEPISPEMATKLAGKIVFLDPGHQGPNHTENLARQVSDGRGGTKDCQTTGMTTLNGVAEHTINWNVAQLVKTSLESLGARVVLSRQDDSGWGGCIDERARAANESGAAVAVSGRGGRRRRQGGRARVGGGRGGGRGGARGGGGGRRRGARPRAPPGAAAPACRAVPPFHASIATVPPA